MVFKIDPRHVAPYYDAWIKDIRRKRGGYVMGLDQELALAAGLREPHEIDAVLVGDRAIDETELVGLARVLGCKPKEITR